MSRGRRYVRGAGQVFGERHGSARLTEDDVIIARLIARDRSLPRGWEKEFAGLRGVGGAALSLAISGVTWASIDSAVPPVPKWKRWRPRVSNRRN